MNLKIKYDGFIRFLFFILFFFTWSLKSFATEKNYLQELIEKAQKEKIEESREWKKLLFIPDRFFSFKKSSLFSDKTFFLAPDGKNNSSNELIYTLKSFFQPLPHDIEKNYIHPQCKYAGRFYFLNKKLNFDFTRLPKQDCQDLDKFISSLEYTSVSLVFSNYVAGGPGSLFGHTFLRLQRNFGNTNQTALLDDIINFSAFVPLEKDFLFAIKGLAGGYQGRFSLLPYYQKIQEYNNFESRDLWEYQLNFSQDEINYLKRIIWEIGWTYIDYFYIDDNCAYAMLALIEAAKPDIYLTEKIKIYSIPSDTIRIVSNLPNFVTSVKYRPSVLSRYLNRLDNLNIVEKNAFSEVLSSKNDKLPDSFLNLSKHSKAKTIDTILEFIDYKEKLIGSAEPQEFKDLRTKILITRANELVKLDNVPEKTHSSPPHLGHDSALLSMSLGYHFNQVVFSDFRIRPALHDIEADENGYSNGLGIGFLDTIIRLDYTNQNYYLNNFHLLEITSLPEQVPHINFLAWHFDSGYEYSYGFGDSSIQGREYLKVGVGGAFFGFQNNALIYFITHADAGYAKDFHWHIGPTAFIGTMAKVNDSIKVLTKSEFARRFNKDSSIDSITNSITFAYYIKQNFELQLNYAFKNNTNEMSFTIQNYF